MRVGVPKEIKNNENRVGMTPGTVLSFKHAGHEVLVQSGAGAGVGFTDEDYEAAGARIVPTAAEAWQAEMVVKVKEPLPEEYAYFQEGQILYTYLHLAPEAELTRALVERKVSAVAYETIQLPDGSLPLLTPMSEVAGRMSIQIGAHFLEKAHGGKGVLLSGVPGVAPGKVAVIGGGIVGTNAAKIALGMGAEVSILDINPNRLRQLDDLFQGRVKTIISDSYHIAETVKSADLVIGAVLIPGARAPRLVTEEMVKAMSPGSVIVDVAIDQGGSIETIDRITTHDHPTYEKHGVIHYAVANMPGAVARTSTLALTNVTAPYGLKIASQGLRQAALADLALAKGINVMDGKVSYKAVAEAHGYAYTDIHELLA
ncbi:alanine dehydrogenase [Paenibacillus campinasensis]|uniref:Alanine dehydrogenase n=1 Tax=Paenibacillus campinasensis TaxID=66347 RepID=A0A268EJ23_9BACL|nr:alanine dehydrogenase [Paenibacillus campinasensis]MUG67932.1 alanine dehydrogenase [Paenibacillus campinasensis]PAD73112.1 alanine dehydrogenase [Paenibacillus campinasensis]